MKMIFKDITIIRTYVKDGRFVVDIKPTRWFIIKIMMRKLISDILGFKDDG